jgi:hypothetical protein
MIDKKTSWFERAEKVVNRVNTVFPNPEFENLKIWNYAKNCY